MKPRREYFVVYSLLFLCSYLRMLSSFRWVPKFALKPAKRAFLPGSVRHLCAEPDGTATSGSHSASTSHPAPNRLKTMLFMDGTWLYYSIVQGRKDDQKCPLTGKYGPLWRTTHQVEWDRLPQIIANNLTAQLTDKKLLSVLPVVDITRCNVFTSMRSGTDPSSPRVKMLANFYKNNFAVHRFENTLSGEKCVDISLAVEMLYLATVPNAYEIACIVTGDKDFIPALQKTRLLGKRVAICSMRNSCNADLIAQEAQLRDFDVIWLDDHLDQIIVPKESADIDMTTELLQMSVEILSQLQHTESVVSSKDFGRELQALRVNNVNALTALKQLNWSVRSFVGHFPNVFKVRPIVNSTDFSIELRSKYEVAMKRYTDHTDSGRGVDDASVKMEAIVSAKGDSYLEALLDTPNTSGSGSSSSSTHTRSSHRYTSTSGSDSRNVPQGPVVDQSNKDHEKTLIRQDLVRILTEYFHAHPVERASSRDLGRHLKSLPYPGFGDAHEALKKTFLSMSSFFKKHTRVFAVQNHPDGPQEGFFVYYKGKDKDNADRSGEVDQLTIDAGSDEEGSGDGKSDSYGDSNNSGEDNNEGGDEGSGADSSGDESSHRVGTSNTSGNSIDGDSADSIRPLGSMEYDEDAAEKAKMDHYIGFAKMGIRHYKVAELRVELEKRGMDTTGKKHELVDRLAREKAEKTHQFYIKFPNFGLVL